MSIALTHPDHPTPRQSEVAMAPPASLAAARHELEALDTEMVALLARRAAVARSAGQVKQSQGLPLVDPVQEAAVVRRAAVLARGTGLPEEEVRAIFWGLIALSRRIQTEIRP
jgi:prephenate dehydrogenase